MTQYSITVDGFEIDTIELPKMPQEMYNKIRQDIANTYAVPVHYICLEPMKPKTENIMKKYIT